MVMALFLFFPILILGLMFLERWRTEKKMFLFLQAIAKQLGINELRGPQRSLLITGVSSNGLWNGKRITLEISWSSHGIETLLELDFPSPVRLGIHRARNLFNLDVIELITGTSQSKLKFQTSPDDKFEMFSNDPSISMQILNSSVIKQRLQLWMENQNDLFEIDENCILVKTVCSTFFGKIDWQEIEQKVIQMWFLVTTISFQLANQKQDINLLKCPYCRSMLNDGVRIVRCNECHTLFHESCWQENGQCAIFRCYGSTSEAVENKSTPR